MHPDDLPSANQDDVKPESERRTPDPDEWSFHDLGARGCGLGFGIAYDLALVDDSTPHPIFVSGNFRLVGRSWTDPTPLFLVNKHDRTIYPFHRVISLRIAKDEDQ